MQSKSFQLEETVPGSFFFQGIERRDVVVWARDITEWHERG